MWNLGFFLNFVDGWVLDKEGEGGYIQWESQ